MSVKDTLLEALEQMDKLEANGGECKHIVVCYLVENGDTTSTLSWCSSPTQYIWERVGMIREIARRMECLQDELRQKIAEEDDDYEDFWEED